MWLLPSNHPLYSAFVQEPLGSNEELNELSARCEQSLMWRSKPSLSKTWLSRWKKVYWLPHLFSRILKPSMHESFVIKYTASLPDIRASLSALPANKKGKKIHDTFSRIYSTLLTQYDLFGASSKTSAATSHWDMTKCKEAFTILVTQLSQEYSLRLKQAQHMRENGCSSLLWKTPLYGDSADREFSVNSRGEPKLSAEVKQWSTPTATEVCQGFQDRSNGKKGSQESLTTEVYKDSLHHPATSNTNGKRHVLSPAWVAQLMGTTLEKIFFDASEME